MRGACEPCYEYLFEPRTEQKLVGCDGSATVILQEYSCKNKRATLYDLVFEAVLTEADSVSWLRIKVVTRDYTLVLFKDGGFLLLCAFDPDIIV